MNVCIWHVFYKIIIPLFVIFNLSFVIFPHFAYAQNKDIIINGDSVSYDKDNSIVEAKGSVEVTYRDVTIYGNHVIYHTVSEEVFADKGFNLHYKGITIEGERLDYLIKKQTGSASEVNFSFKNIILKGDKIRIGTEQFDLKNASFSTCDLLEPHYHVTAGDISIYPKYGWLVAYWGYFWLGNVPIVPVPTYIYDLYAEEKGRRNLPPFPEITSNDEDGVHFNQRLAWHLRRELSGTYSINYATKKGLGGGVEADYIVDENSRGNARFNVNTTDGVGLGITHRLFFGGEVKKESRTLLPFLTLPVHQQYELEATLSSRERINYEWVSFCPNLALKMRKNIFFRKDFKYDAELMLGMVREESSIDSIRGGGKLGVYWDLPGQSLGIITPSLSLDSRYYSNGTQWTKTSGELELQRVFSKDLMFGLGYSHYFSVVGASPFNFEMYRFSPVDRLTSHLFFLLGETGVGFDTSYFLDTWQPEDIDYSLFFRMHCYNLMVKYRSLRREFELGFTLART